MKQIFELFVFCSFAVALHLGLMIRPPSAGAEAAGESGAALMSLQAASAQMEQIVENWDKPVEVADTPDTLPSPDPVVETLSMVETPPDLAVIQTAAIALPDMTPPDVTPPKLDEIAAPPPPKIKPKPKPKPKSVPKPAPKKKAAEKARPATAGQQAQKASGSGGGQSAGKAGAASAASLSNAKQTSLTRQWGAKIRARVSRQKRYPQGASGTGRVVLSISVSRDGTVTSARIAKSSGIATFDKAALAAVSRAGRMPAAPKSLSQSSYSFNLPIDFN